MLNAAGRHLTSNQRPRRLGWIGVVLSVLVNGLLFGALAYVNEHVERRADGVAFTSIRTYVPPQEIEELPEEVEIERELELMEPELEPLEPMLMMAAPMPLLPRIPMENLAFDDASAMQVVVADLPVLIDAAQGPMELSDVDHPPTKRSGAFPSYPSWAQSRGLEAYLTVQFVVNVDGSVSEVSVTRLKGDERFRAIAIAAVRKWRFAAGVYRGEAVPVRCFQKLRFRLEDW